MTTPVSRRRMLALGIGAIAGCLSDPREQSEPTDTEDGSTPRPATTSRTTEPGCGTPIRQEWVTREIDPSVPPCPEKPEDLDACSARAFALGLEQHHRYERAIERHGRLSEVAFQANTATVTRTPAGFIVSTRLYFTATPATESPGTDPATGTETATRNGTETTTGTTDPTTAEPTNPGDWPTGLYDVDYLVTDDEQWRAVGNPGGFQTAGALRLAGSVLGCVGGT